MKTVTKVLLVIAVVLIYLFSVTLLLQFGNETVKPETVSSQKSPQQIFEDNVHVRVDDLMKNLTYTKYVKTGQLDRCNATNVIYNSDKTFSMALVLVIPCYRIPPEMLKVESLDNPKTQPH